MLMHIMNVERQIFRFKYSTGRTKCNSITISLRLLRLFICFYLLFPHLPFRTQIMKLRTRDSRTKVLLTNLCGHDKSRMNTSKSFVACRFSAPTLHLRSSYSSSSKVVLFCSPSTPVLHTLLPLRSFFFVLPP